jgi:uncharacterized protein
MFLDLRKIGDEGVRFDQQLRLPPLAAGNDENVAVREARLRGQAVPGGRGVELTAHLDARVGLRCSRCLECFVQPISTDLHLTIVADAVEYGSGETELSEEDVSLFYAEEGKADLGEIAREQIYLDLPLKPICRPSCKGLCPTCGSDRNRIKCACSRETPDPRLAPLLDLKKRLSGDS